MDRTAGCLIKVDELIGQFDEDLNKRDEPVGNSAEEVNRSVGNTDKTVDKLRSESHYHAGDRPNIRKFKAHKLKVAKSEKRCRLGGI